MKVKGRKKGARTGKAKPSAPSARTRQVIVAEALASMSEGVSIRKIAAKEGMAFSTLHEWLTVPELSGQYTRAREAQAIWWVEKALAVSAGTDDEVQERAVAMVDGLEGIEEKDKQRLLDSLAASAIQRDRLHVDTLKWTASKFYRKQFGEQVDLTTGGESLTALIDSSMKITTEKP